MIGVHDPIAPRALESLSEIAAAGNDPAVTCDVFEELVVSVLAEVALPGRDTPARFGTLAAVAEGSPAVARLVEGHLDALAIMDELGSRPPEGALLGVWAAEPGGHHLGAARSPTGWCLRGIKPYASGRSRLTHALVTARDRDARLLFLLDLSSGVRELAGTWPSVGMAGTDSGAVEIEVEVEPAALIGRDGVYTTRAGFWHGAAGVAMCWLGGARGVAQPLLAAVGGDSHLDAHAGAVDAALSAAGCLADEVAHRIDADPTDRDGRAELWARRLRAVVEDAATLVLERTGRALGASPLCLDPQHSRRVVDLATYLRQSHAEADLARLGVLAGSAAR